MHFLIPLFLAACAFSRTLLPRDRQCSRMMCITATANGSQVNYELSSTGQGSVGWMGMGFGQSMVNTPMVIMWSNPDGTVTMSQRTASSHSEPSVDSNPPRVATLVNSLTSVSGQNPSFGFSVPASGSAQHNVIYAFSSTPPSSSSPDARLQIHIDKGVLRLDSGTSTPPGGSSSSPGGSFPSNGQPLLPSQRVLIAHALFCVIGFLFFLPLGALLARYLRTFNPTWFQGHWIIQFAIGGLIILIGFMLGCIAVTKAGGNHFNTTHQRLGLALFIMYLFQVTLGAVIHFVKPANRTSRPLQNYAHAIIGLLIIALAMYQVYLGFHREWPRTGLQPFPKGVKIFYIIWVVLLPVLYFSGLALLPRQFAQENANRLRSVKSSPNGD